MNSLRSASFVLVILLVMFGWLFQISLTIEGSFLTNDFYRKLFEKVDLTPYARAMMYEEIEKSLPITLPESTIDMAVSSLSNIYDKKWMEKELLVVIDDLILFVKGKKPPPPLLLNLTEKNEVLRERLKDNLVIVKQEIPFLSIFDPLFGDQGVESLIDNIPMPTHFDLNDYFAEKGITDDIIGSVKKFKQFRNFSLYLPILYFVFCLFILILSNILPKALKLVAFGILVSGITYLLLIVARKPLFLNSLEMSMRTDGIGEAQAIIQALEYALVKSLHIPSFFILAGLMLLLASLLLDLYIPQNRHDEDY